MLRARDAMDRRYAEPLDGPFVAMLRERAAAHGALVVAGLLERQGGGVANTVVAVDAFLQNRIRWADISAVIAATLDHHDGAPASDAAAVIAADAESRRVATDLLARFDPPGAPS